MNCLKKYVLGSPEKEKNRLEKYSVKRLVTFYVFIDIFLIICSFIEFTLKRTNRYFNNMFN